MNMGNGIGFSARNEEKILLIDDEEKVLKTWIPLIQDWGYKVSGAGTLDQARRLLNNDHFDAIVLDLRLKEGDRAGLDFLKEIRREWPKIAVLVLTGYGKELLTIRDAMHLGADEYCEKGEVPATIRTHLNRAIKHQNMKNELESIHRVREDQLKALSKLTEQVSRPMAGGELTKTFVELAIKHTGCKYGTAHLVDKDRVTIEYYSHGLTPCKPEDVFIVGRKCPALSNRRMDKNEEIDNSKSSKKHVYWIHYKEKPRSLLAIPMLYKNNIMGVLSIGDDKPRIFKQDEIRFLEILAYQAAIIAQSNLDIWEAKALNDLDDKLKFSYDHQEYLTKTANFIMKFFEAENLLIYIPPDNFICLPDEKKRSDSLQNMAKRIASDSGSSEIYSCHHLPLQDGFKTMLGVPLNFGDERLGSLVLADRKQSANWECRFSRYDEALLLEMSECLAAAISRERLRNIVEQRNRELKTLNSINDELNKTNNSDQVIRLIAKQTKDLLRARECSVFALADHEDLYNLARQKIFPLEKIKEPTFLLRATTDESLSALEGKVFYQFGESLTGRLALLPGSYCNNHLSETEHVHPRYAPRLNYHHFMGISLRSTRGDVIGAIKVMDKHDENGELTADGFEPQDEALLQDIASQAAIALEKALLMEKIQLTEERWRTLLNFTDTLQHSLREEEILYMFLTGLTIKEGLGFNRAILLMPDETEENLQGNMAIGPADESDAERIWNELNEINFSFEMAKRTYYEQGYNRNSPIQQLANNISVPLDIKDDIFPRATYYHGKSIRIDMEVTPAKVFQDYLEKINTGAFALAPLIAGGKILGAIHVDNRFNSRPITDEDMDALEIFTAKAAGALNNARSLEEASKASYIDFTQTAHSYADNVSAIRNVLSSAMDFAVKSHPTDGKLMKYLERISSDMNKLARVSKNITLLSRSSKLSPKPIDINEILEKWSESKTESIRKRIKLSIDCKEKVLADSKKLKGVLDELLNNALRYSPDDTNISVKAVKTGKEIFQQLTYPISRHENWIHLSVADSGPGINNEEKRKIFLPLVSDQKELGRGMGLPIARKDMEDQGGFLFEEGVPGKGARFVILLPLYLKGC